MSYTNTMTYEDWLRGCVYHDGRNGNVYLPCDKVLKIADWIEAHRNAVPTDEALREQLEKAIAQQETLRKEKEALRALVIAIVERLIESIK